MNRHNALQTVEEFLSNKWTKLGALTAAATVAVLPAPAAAEADPGIVGTVPGGPVCQIYSAENQWGDCANGHSGGEWSVQTGDFDNDGDVDKIAVLSDWNYSGNAVAMKFFESDD